MALSPMYPPSDKLPEDHPKPNEVAVLVRTGFFWLAVGGFLLLTRKPSRSATYLAIALCFWIQAWAAKAGISNGFRLLIGVGAFMTFVVAGYFSGLF